jgi:hypothetical protein
MGEAERGIGNDGLTTSSAILSGLFGAFGLMLLIAILLFLLWRRQAKKTTEKEVVCDMEAEFVDEMAINDSIEYADLGMTSFLNPENASDLGEFDECDEFGDFIDFYDGADEIFGNKAKGNRSN